MTKITDPTSWKMSPLTRLRHWRLRARRGFSEQDWWNFSDYMAWVNIQALEKFKTGAGHPADLANMNEWADLLEKMIDGFRAHLELNDIGLGDDYESLAARRDAGLALYVERFASIWD